MLSQSEFERLLALRTGVRRFLHWSDEQAVAAGLTPAQHQLLLSVGGHPDPAGPTIGDVADYLVLRHHSASELVDRAAAAGLVERRADVNRGSVVRVVMTPTGVEKLSQLTGTHLRELSQMAPIMRELWAELERGNRSRS
jgi:DNA-binding MarR family transcriptional regulator